MRNPLSHAVALFMVASSAAPPAMAQAEPSKAVEDAVRRGLDYLKTAGYPSPLFHKSAENSDEVILWTLLRAGAPRDDAKFQELLKTVLTEPLKRTYAVSLQAVLLEELDRVKHRDRIAQCGQFLLDNQCRNGQWPYGTPTPALDAWDARSSAVKKTRDGPETGDNSNSCYAALALRACRDAGIDIPKEVVSRAREAWLATQRPDSKGWNYGSRYGSKEDGLEYTPWGSMTAGAVAALVICDSMLGIDWKTDAAVNGGLEWLAQNFSVKTNPRHRDPKLWLSSHLYAVERASSLYGTEKLGTHEWYREGVEAILAAQLPDGSWHGGTKFCSDKTWDTCLSILFLKRATRPIASAGVPKE